MLAGAIRGATFVSLEGSHDAPITHPRAFARALRELTAGLDRAGATSARGEPGEA